MTIYLNFSVASFIACMNSAIPSSKIITLCRSLTPSRSLVSVIVRFFFPLSSLSYQKNKFYFHNLFFCSIFHSSSSLLLRSQLLHPPHTSLYMILRTDIPSIPQCTVYISDTRQRDFSRLGYVFTNAHRANSS